MSLPNRRRRLSACEVAFIDSPIERRLLTWRTAMLNSSATLPVILTGDRTTGPLHLGHYVGSLKNRVALQTTHRQYLLLADTQALTDNAHDSGRVRDNVLEIATD